MPSKKLYKYTIYKQDGSIEELPACAKKDFRELYGLLDCSTVEIIPSDYYRSKKWGRVTCYGDDEARFNSSNQRNPHFDVIVDTTPVFGGVWDVVGDIVKEEVAK